ncbi:hypothetical protein [Synechococcus sp. 1G10]|uniref:hypothetical protein n=1 Tax=Synechococcus sp. 1G10 TaxID=2025605 RepID=UPI001E308A75|nr:hypothetical protein [Synechococcus sp. 1G10]
MMNELDLRLARLTVLRQRLPGLVRGIQESWITPERKAELAADYEQTLGDVLALAEEVEPR